MSIAWQPVSAGAFIMGSDDHRDREKPQHEVSIPYDYQISRYPITQAQYAVFVKEGGYTEGCRPFWTESGWQAKKEEGWTGPEPYGHPFQLGNHPVVGVSWFEAVAFCRWLTEWERQAGRLPSSHLIRLPTEAEWERVARGTDGRSYPWGNEPPDSDRLNYNYEVGNTTAVGLYPRGVSPVGCFDTTGNVWEWCATQWSGQAYPYDTSKNEWTDDYLKNQHKRSARGGAWDYSDVHCRATVRYGNLPHARNYVQGLRVVVSPIFRFWLLLQDTPFC